MPSIETVAELAVPISKAMLGADVYARFEREPDTLVIPVVEDGKPIGIIERNSFFLRMAAEYGRALYAKRPIEGLMDRDAVIVEASLSLETFCQTMLEERPSALLRGFIVVDDGYYLGVGTVLSLLQATSAASRERAEEMTEVARSLSVAQTAAQASARAKSQFLAVMSHEIRTPMNGVLAVAELLQRQPLNTQAKAYVKTIIDSSETLLRLLNDALDLSRAEMGELKLTPQPDFLNELMDDVLALWSPRAAQDNVRLTVSFDGDPNVSAHFDQIRVKQVFNNLIGNAIKFARGGLVEATLKAEVKDNRVVISSRIRDNGPGIPKEKLESIFKPFVHAPGAEQGGAGLGLAICRQIIEAMGGKIWAESNQGAGATFAWEATLPAANLTRETETNNVTALNDLAISSAPHILIVDDNATNRVVAQALVQMFGCTSETAEDGLEAVEAVQQRPFDLILMDIKMPRMDGVSATKAIRALPGEAALLPIIALTANADPDDAATYLASGMCAVVEKPIKPERLLSAINIAFSPQEAASGQGAEPAKSAEGGSKVLKIA